MLKCLPSIYNLPCSIWQECKLFFLCETGKQNTSCESFTVWAANTFLKALFLHVTTEHQWEVSANWDRAATQANKGMTKRKGETLVNDLASPVLRYKRTVRGLQGPQHGFPTGLQNCDSITRSYLRNGTNSPAKLRVLLKFMVVNLALHIFGIDLNTNDPHWNTNCKTLLGGGIFTLLVESPCLQMLQKHVLLHLFLWE